MFLRGKDLSVDGACSYVRWLGHWKYTGERRSQKWEGDEKEKRTKEISQATRRTQIATRRCLHYERVSNRFASRPPVACSSSSAVPRRQHSGDGWKGAMRARVTRQSIPSFGNSKNWINMLIGGLIPIQTGASNVCNQRENAVFARRRRKNIKFDGPHTMVR